MFDRLRRLARFMSAGDPRPAPGESADGDVREPADDARDDERARMVDVQLRARGIADERVLAAMQAVPRDAFVAAYLPGSAYADDALPIEAGPTISQPHIVGRVTELLRGRPARRVLHIGTG